MPKGVYERMPKPLSERFLAKVDRRGPDECWPWQGAKLPAGYGKIGRGGRGEGWTLAHRVAYALAYGDPPDDRLILHSCDNPSCCNPAHLRVGSHTDNRVDFLMRGKRGPRARLSTGEVKAIREDPRTYAAIARDHGIGGEAVGRVKRRKTWRWLD
jgi:hypothetical protein